MASEPRRDLPIPLRVELRRPDGSTTAEYAVNISPGGLCLHLKEPLSEGDVVGVEFSLPPSGPTVRADAGVVWVRGQEAAGGERRFCEVGVRFDGLEESVERQLSEYASRPANRRR